MLTGKIQTVVTAKNIVCLANLTRQFSANDNMHVQVDELNNRSSSEEVFIPMQLQNKIFHDIGVCLGKLASW